MLEVTSLDALVGLVHSCASDLRHTLSTLQFLAQSSSVAQQSPEDTSMISEVQWPTSAVFDTIYHSYLPQSWKESSLQPFFDALTREHTEKYEHSHRILTKASAENKQRFVRRWIWPMAMFFFVSHRRLELYDTFKYFMQEQEMENITDRPSFYLDYRPYARQICQSEQNRITESNVHRR